jgi:putative DNA methylase
MTIRKKLIEVTLPLEAINTASAREKSIRHGHPSTLHLWWARRPLAAARAVIFAQMVDDPSAWPNLFPTEKAQDKERKRLFKIIEQLVTWENTTNEDVLKQARAEIWESWRRACADNADHPRAAELFNRFKLPAFHDPFAGGGALPLEAQRLGLESYASDLNPVAVLINKAMIEIPPKFAGKPPVNPVSRASEKNSTVLHTWQGAEGLAEDVRYYGQWMRDEAEKRIGHLYPKIEITKEMVRERPDLKPLLGQKLTVIAWIWARTVKSPNPAFAHVEVPLASTFMLSTKPGKEAYIEPAVHHDTYAFKVKVGAPRKAAAAQSGTKLARANFQCLLSGAPISGDYIKAEGKAKRMGARLMAIAAEGERGRVYLSPTDEMERIAAEAQPTWKPEGEVPARLTGGTCVPYGLEKWSDLFTPRQLVALTTFSDLVQEAREQAMRDAIAAGMSDDGVGLDAGGAGATAYGEAISVYLGFLVNQVANHSSSICGWNTANAQMRAVFARQAIPMVWDYAESNPFSSSSGSFNNLFERQLKGFEALGTGFVGLASQANVNDQTISKGKVVSTDPPYYDNIGYADLSDFFYVWLRRAFRNTFANLFSTLTVPKAEELVAVPYRHGGIEKAEKFFLENMTAAMHGLASSSHDTFPVTIYYAFKQTEEDSVDGIASTGWETFIEAVIKAGFGVSGTWPIRTEKSGRVIGNDTNALASSIVLVCRRRDPDAPTATRREFLAALKAELPSALRKLQQGNIAPVDLAQSAIGPGMAVYTRYRQVLDAEGHPLRVRDALKLINETLDEVLSEQEGDFDADSRWALAWFELYGFADGEFGRAETLSKAKNTSVAGMVEAGLLKSRQGKVRLLRPEELPADWDPEDDNRLTAWEAVHHLVRALNEGESAAAQLAAKLGAQAEVARELAYRLYTLCERKKRAQDALAYNALVQSWPEIMRLAQGEAEDARRETPAQERLL